MRTSVLLLLASVLLVPLAHADSDDLSGGVLLVHAPPGVVYTSNVTTWCDSTYLAECEDQVNTVAANTEAVWFVLSAWSEEKTFSGVEFGLGDFEPESFVFLEDGICLDDAMALHYPSVEDWPGPNTGIALAANGDAWTGQLVPIAWFAAYNYAEGDTIAITENPATGHAGWLSGESHTTYDAECLGALGLGADGTGCCPAQDLDEGAEGSEPSDGVDSADNVGDLGPHVPRTVLAMIPRESLTFPPAVGTLTLEEAQAREDAYLATSLAEDLENEGVTTLTQCVPDFNPCVVGRDGNPVLGRDGNPLMLPNDLSLWFRLSLDHDDVAGAIERLGSSVDILAVEHSRPPEQHSDSLNPLLYPQQWNLDNQGQYCDAVQHVDLNVLPAWALFGKQLEAPGGDTVKIALLDDGVEEDHPDLPSTFLYGGHDYVDGHMPPEPRCPETDSHGTEIAGIMGMEPDNGIGGVGLAYGAVISSIRVNGCDQDPDVFESDYVDGLEYAASHGYKIVNLCVSPVGDPGLSESMALQNLKSSGAVVVSSAGNDNLHYSDVSHRLRCSVGGFIPSGERWRDCKLPPYPTTGSPSGSNFGKPIDLVAPTGIIATVLPLHEEWERLYDDFWDPEREKFLDPDCDSTDQYRINYAFSGTSAAAPQVSSLMAAILSRNAAWDGEDAQAIACSTATDHVLCGACDSGWDEQSGFGRPDFYRAMLVASDSTCERVTNISAQGGTFELDGTGTAVFRNLQIVADGAYEFERWKASREVTVQNSYSNPLAWGRAQGSVGWRVIDDGDEYDAWYEEPGHTTIGALDETTITLVNWYYKLHTLGGVIMIPDSASIAMSFTIANVPAAAAQIETDMAAGESAALMIGPNPGGRAVRIWASGGASGKERVLEIVSVEGRLVQRLVVPGEGAIEWDLRDITGGRVGSGVYFARLVGRGPAAVSRLIIIR